MSASIFNPDTKGYLDFVISHSTPGDASSALSAMDLYADTHSVMHIGHKKGELIDNLIKDREVNVMVHKSTNLVERETTKFSSKLIEVEVAHPVNPQETVVDGLLIADLKESSKYCLVMWYLFITSRQDKPITHGDRIRNILAQLLIEENS